MKRLIFIPSVQGTGTWFLLNLLKPHPQVDYLVTWLGFDEQKLELSNMAVVQAHFGEGKTGPEFGAFVPDDTAEGWMRKATATVIPVRDPLLSLMTANNRRLDDAPLDHIINGFLTMSRWAGENDIFFLPVDLYGGKSASERRKIFSSLIRFCGLDFIPHCEEYARRWQVVNTAYGQKNHYHAGNIEAVKEELGPYFDKLVANKEILRPFLERLGYSNLLWW
ncbi:MAG: hypothetical protein ACYC36_16635 [Bellilinea sp.]